MLSRQQCALTPTCMRRAQWFAARAWLARVLAVFIPLDPVQVEAAVGEIARRQEPRGQIAQPGAPIQMPATSIVTAWRNGAPGTPVVS